MNQTTIREGVHFSGIGIHTGQESTVHLLPAKEDHGIKFKRVDLNAEISIAADTAYVTSTNRATTLAKGDIEVRTIEHLLSAIYGAGIDNILIEVDGPEIPILDGSSFKFLEEIQRVGVDTQEKDRDIFSVEEEVRLNFNGGDSEYILLPSDTTEITVVAEFDKYNLPNQVANLKSFDEYAENISACRTFVFAHELKDLYAANLIKGGSLSNALIVQDKSRQADLKELSAFLSAEEISILNDYLRKGPEHCRKNELAGHKMLDLIGDLALLGKPFKGRLIARNPGHSSNLEFTKLLKQLSTKQKKLKNKPAYDVNKDPVYDVEGVQSLLPHRYPFLLVDKIIELTPTKVVGIKNISFNEFYFQGHFPGNPIFPGVLQMEALAQTGGVLALCDKENADQWDTYFLKMDNVRFKQKVIPGDTLILKMELLSPIRRGIVHMQGTAYVGDKIVSEGELTAQIVHARKSVDD